jgi:hypothetical protein
VKILELKVQLEELLNGIKKSNKRLDLIDDGRT